MIVVVSNVQDVKIRIPARMIVTVSAALAKTISVFVSIKSL